MTGPDIDVRDNPAASRYELRVDGKRAGVIVYRLGGDGTIEMFHTEVDPRRQRAGLGGELVSYALDDARSRGLRVIPSCPFVAAYINEHRDEFGDLVGAR